MTTPPSPDTPDAGRPSRMEPAESSPGGRPPRPPATGRRTGAHRSSGVHRSTGAHRSTGVHRSSGSPTDHLDQQVRDRYGTWRDQPRGLACAVIGAFMILTTLAFVFAVIAVVKAMR